MDQLNKDLIKTIKIIHFGLLIGPIILLSIAIYFITNYGPFSDVNSFNQLLIIISNIIVAGSLFFGFFQFKKQKVNINKQKDNEKIITYRSAMIIRAASLEGCCFLFIVFYFLNGSLIMLIEATVMIAVLLIFFPTNYRLSKELKIDLREFE